MKTTASAKPETVERRWFVVDAGAAPLGRIASQVAHVLRGKHKPSYTPHVDCGDHVVIVNAAGLKLTGGKMEGKIYDRYSGYQSGRYVRTAQEQYDRDPRTIVESAVRGMLPKTKLGRAMFKKLKVYEGAEHPHAAQNPQPLELKV